MSAKALLTPYGALLPFLHEIRGIGNLITGGDGSCRSVPYAFAFRLGPGLDDLELLDQGGSLIRVFTSSCVLSQLDIPLCERDFGELMTVYERDLAIFSVTGWDDVQYAKLNDSADKKSPEEFP